MNEGRRMNDSLQDTCPLYHSGSSLRIGELAPDFVARTNHGQLTLSALRGKWVMLFAHPADFTPVCTSEFITLARMTPQFSALNCVLLGVSVDSLPSHIAWVESIRERFGVEIPFPIIEDPSMAIARAYGMLDSSSQNSVTVRAVYMIDPDGVVQAMTWYPYAVGRCVQEMLRLLQALQRVAGGDALTPEGWQPGDDVLQPQVQVQQDITAIGPEWFMKMEGEQKK